MRTRNRKPQEHDIARHVGHEDVPQNQIAERIDEAGDQCHRNEERRQRTEAIGTRHQGLPDLSEEGAHVGALLS